VNLSVADLLVLLTCVPTGMHDLFARERWYPGMIMCHLIAFIENCMSFASILFIFFITLGRYLIICKPLSFSFRLNQQRSVLTIAFVCIVSILVNAPLVFLSEHNLKRFVDSGELEYTCNTKSNQTWSLFYMVSVTFLFYVIIGVVLVFMFVKIILSLRRSTQFLLVTGSLNEKRNSLNTITLQNKQEPRDVLEKLNKYSQERETKEGNNNPKMNEDDTTKQPTVWRVQQICKEEYENANLQKYIKQRRQIVAMLICVLSAFYLCIFPIKIWSLVMMFGSNIPRFYAQIGLNNYWFINITVRIFFYLNSCINPLLYNCLSLKFRESFKRLLIFRPCFSETY
jgi:hypothetical protein